MAVGNMKGAVRGFHVSLIENAYFIEIRYWDERVRMISIDSKEELTELIVSLLGLLKKSK